MKRNQFGNIRKLPSGRFQARYTDPITGKRLTAKGIDGASLTFTSEREARIYLVNLESDLHRGINPYAKPEIDSCKLIDRINAYLDPSAGLRLNAEPLRESTLRNYRNYRDRFIDRQIAGINLAQMQIREITRGDVMRWHIALKDSCQDSQVEIKDRAHPARRWARSQGLSQSIHGRISPELIKTWIAAGAPEIKRYRIEKGGIDQVAKAYTFLRAVLNVALEDGIIKENPCRIKGAGQSRHAERVTATHEQIAALADEVPERYRAAVLLALFTSARRSELFGLQRKHINALQNTITIEHQLSDYSTDKTMFAPTKTPRKTPIVPIPKVLMDVLQDHLDRFTKPDPDALVFTTSNGYPIYKGRMSWWVTAKRRLNLDHLHFHDLRHTGQTMAMEKGATAQDLKRRAGQSSDNAMRIYLHGNPKRDRVLADSLSDEVENVISLMASNG
jgi:integrase